MKSNDWQLFRLPTLQYLLTIFIFTKFKTPKFRANTKPIIAKFWVQKLKTYFIHIHGLSATLFRSMSLHNKWNISYNCRRHFHLYVKHTIQSLKQINAIGIYSLGTLRTLFLALKLSIPTGDEIDLADAFMCYPWERGEHSRRFPQFREFAHRNFYNILDSGKYRWLNSKGWAYEVCACL